MEKVEKNGPSEIAHAENDLEEKGVNSTKKIVQDAKDEGPPKTTGVHVKPNHACTDDGPEAPPPEGGWGWVVCFTSMCTNGTVFANTNTFGIMLVALIDTFDEEDPNISFKASWVGSVLFGVLFLLGMVSGILADRLGIRTVSLIGGLLALVGMLCSAFVQNILLLYLTYGVIMGTGFSLAYTPSVAILGHYFKRRIGLANGLVAFGGALIFILGYSLALPVLFDAIGFKYTLLCISGMNGLIMFYALTWKPRIHRRSDSGEGRAAEGSAEARKTRCSCSSDLLNKRIWRNRGYVLWVVATSVSFLGYGVPLFHLVKHAEDVFPGSGSNLLPICLGVSNAVMKLAVASLSDLRRVRQVRLQQAAFLVMGMTTSCTPLAGTFPSLLVIAVVFGMCDGTLFCMFGPVAFDLVGPADSAQALGFVFGLLALPGALGPPLAGFLYDHYGNYDLAFHLAGIPLMLGAGLLLFIPRGEPHALADISIEEVPSKSSPSADHVTSHKTNKPMAMDHVTTTRL
ncbi:hypothetical protein BaRGS_00015696 [Batillaria attramentaria]|uniref:Uncharacterized protein n=1 Tax=Batillaria attramentaria TaxID=370345 RepID=A0ABD0L143_9CAEN